MMFDLTQAEEVLAKVRARCAELENQRSEIDQELAVLAEKDANLSLQIDAVRKLLAEISETEQILSTSPEAVSSVQALSPEVQKGGKKSQYGMWAPIIRMLRFAFSARDVPASLEELLEGYYSPRDWTLEKISAPMAGGKHRWMPRNLAEDLKLGPDSMLRRHLAAGYQSLSRYQKDLKENPELEAWIPLRNLYSDIIKAGFTLNGVRETFEQWGVPIQ